MKLYWGLSLAEHPTEMNRKLLVLGGCIPSQQPEVDRKEPEFSKIKRSGWHLLKQLVVSIGTNVENKSCKNTIILQKFG